MMRITAGSCCMGDDLLQIFSDQQALVHCSFLQGNGDVEMVMRDLRFECKACQIFPAVQ